MKLLKRDRMKLETVLISLRRGQAFLMQSDVHVARETGMMSSDTFVDGSGKRISSMNKEIGSDLAVLHSAIQKLENLLEE